MRERECVSLCLMCGVCVCVCVWCVPGERERERERERENALLLRKQQLRFLLVVSHTRLERRAVHRRY